MKARYILIPLALVIAAVGGGLVTYVVTRPSGPPGHELTIDVTYPYMCDAGQSYDLEIRDGKDELLFAPVLSSENGKWIGAQCEWRFTPRLPDRPLYQVTTRGSKPTRYLKTELEPNWYIKVALP